jgi:hypothetical protein
MACAACFICLQIRRLLLNGRHHRAGLGLDVDLDPGRLGYKGPRLPSIAPFSSKTSRMRR